MNEKQITRQLKLLKTIQPNQDVLNAIKKDVCHSIQAENTLGNQSRSQSFFRLLSLLFQSYRIVVYGMSAAVFTLLLLSVFFIYPNQLQDITLYGKLTFASNQYERANIAFVDSARRFEDKTVDEHNAHAVLQSISFINTELSRLKLKGEKGKYTANQCHILYQRYLSYLKREYAATPQSFSGFRSQILAYEEQAEQKLNMYHNL